MKLFHKTCGSEVRTTTDKFTIRILDFCADDNGVLKESLIDIDVAKTGGRIHLYCPTCKEALDFQKEVSVSCLRCGHTVQIDEVYGIKGGWPVLCKRCHEQVWISLHKDQGIPYTLMSLKLE